jgi:MoxR-like ATPase
MAIEVNDVIEEASNILYGKERELKLALSCILANGHLLIEDVPGVGKTTMVHLMGKLLGLEISRIQFTNDLLPSDILGVNIFNKNENAFNFKKGPIFGELILADELNRATPKTQSALLQAMEERRISIDGNNFELENPFLIIATQNPFYQIGTFPLPESQLDRFLMSLFLDFPSREFERKILLSEQGRDQIKKKNRLLEKKELLEWQKKVTEVEASEAIIEYILNLLSKGREDENIGSYLSPRSGKDLLKAARAFAFIEGRSYVIPEDIQTVLPGVFGHRVELGRGVRWGHQKMKSLIHSVPLNS